MFSYTCTVKDTITPNLAGYKARKRMEMKMDMDAHMRRALDFARANHPWQSQSGAALDGLAVQTEIGGAIIVGTIGGLDMHNWYLENRCGSIYPYGNKNATPFGSRFRILEQARDESLGQLASDLAETLSRP